jgi:hypothetical protein
MIVCCIKCGRCYDIEDRWTICPHAPLWTSPHDYCPKHDLVNCPICKEEHERQISRTEGSSIPYSDLS